ncbi:hypothetical protein FEI17_00205 [Kosakonia radicincitans]|uniref:Uncharacterized protein n=1 Tax=Kosakonia radicincitans TaxID=283686 RepID=A0AAX2EXN2_9ENTR|nr:MULTISPECIES: hypothetical protein [Kosakonia]MDP9568489.1 hypothetical protein [Kosakonia oryzae]MDD7996644.1 hypothetical protein [Kosakonia radicincitans]QEM89151.1 hypothetical protein FEI17_00205 [Kosakonia radicincitans]SET37123.1 hypothetical protein SAMN03159294_3623 [Kosakonia radicincitans]SFF31142.1 hypothetical protein SAMN03159468_04612 [Kosakonia radicincitans]
MLDKSNTTLTPDRTTLVESNGCVYLSFAFNDKKDNMLIKLGLFEVNYLADEFDELNQRILISSEYN